MPRLLAVANPRLRMVTIFPLQFATAADRNAVIELLQAAGLPSSDVPTTLDGFLLARDEEVLLGTVGLEVFGSVALLRSLAVVPAWRQQGLGQQLTRAILQHATDLSVRSVYLITTTAESFFHQAGFESLPRSETPTSIQQTAQFTGVCPASAIVMVKRLP